MRPVYPELGRAVNAALRVEPVSPPLLALGGWQGVAAGCRQTPPLPGLGRSRVEAVSLHLSQAIAALVLPNDLSLPAGATCVAGPLLVGWVSSR